MRKTLNFAVPTLLALTACASGPQERIVRGEFQCEAGPKLKVAFNLDHAAEGYSLVGVGDEVTWATPEGAPRTCRESR